MTEFIGSLIVLIVLLTIVAGLIYLVGFVFGAGLCAGGLC